jgi:release factor glutamine methyltransferase
MSSSSKKVFFGDYVFHVTENVYEPAEDSFLFAENLSVREGARVADIGTGCGMLGIIAAAKAKEVVGVDLNPYAVRCAKENATVNHVANKLSFLQGDLFSAIRAEEKFDLILFNAPYLPSEPGEENSWIGRAWAGGVSGRHVIDSFIREGPKHLKAHGQILLMQSTLSDVEETLNRLEEKGLKTDILAKQFLPFFEKVVLIRARLTNRK